MPLKKLLFKPGVNRENTRYTTEGGWYSCDKVRFRSGQPEKIGGWQRINDNTFLGVCRSLWAWDVYIGTGTNLKYYVFYDSYYDITPIRASGTINNNPFALAASTTVTVTDTAHGCVTGDFVTFSGAVDIGGAGPPPTNVTAAILNQEFQVTVIDANTYTIQISVTPNATALAASPGGGAAVVASYQLNTGDAISTALTGWGAGGWGAGGWGTGATSLSQIRLWNAYNFGDDLIFGPKGGGIYYWDASAGTGTRGVDLRDLPGAPTGDQAPPSVANYRVVSDASRFVLVFGTNDIGLTDLDPMLIRWSDQENPTVWYPAATNQAGSLQLSHGTEIKAVAQVRQELIVWTDTALYSLQYLGPPIVWGSQLLADNISIVSDRAWATAAGVTYWMGDEKFYLFNGRTETLPCDLRLFVFSDFNFDQRDQVFASTVEQFNEVWWFYCSANSTTVDRYVIYNYVERAWYYGTLARTAWIDASTVANVPIAAAYNNKLILHETGVDNGENPNQLPIDAYITSSEFDIDDGHNFGFIWRLLPDITFTGSAVSSPSVTMSLLPLQNSGSGYTRGKTPVASVDADMSVAGENSYPVTRVTTVPIEQFTQQVNIRVRGRQMSMKVESDALGVQWQLGAPRIDIRQSGRKS